MKFIENVFGKLKRHPKRIVFPEGDDPRVVRAAHYFYEHDLGVPILLGKRDDIERIALAEKVSLDHAAIINPETSSDLPTFCQRLEKLERYKKMGIKNASAVMVNHNYYAAMMIQYGLADALVGGLASDTGSLLRPLVRIVKPLPHAQVVAGCSIIEVKNKQFGDDGVLFLADTGVVPDPTMEQIASIAFETGLLARQVFGHKPRIAMLSFSTKGSATSASTEKMAGAVIMTRQLADKYGVEIAVDGEMQADTAIVPEIAAAKMEPSLVAGKANVLIFPDLNSGNIATKLVQQLAGAKIYNQILLGLSRPAADLSRGASADDIASVSAIVGIQAVEYHKMYPSDEGGT